MKSILKRPRQGFTLLETVIAIGVFSVLLTGFIVVFGPAVDGIRKSINMQQADRLVTTLEQELVTVRDASSGAASFPTGFDKSFNWIKQSTVAADALVVYQYRGKLDQLRSDDQTPIPEPDIKGKVLGQDYIVFSVVRRKSDTKFVDDLKAIEGSVYFVKCTQMVFGANGMELGIPGQIRDPKPAGSPVSNSDDYTEAVIAFTAEFYQSPSKDASYYTGSAFDAKFIVARNPVFARNLAVRR
jgi:prepilin-type N-terminal cleavage/methylation domain-containing protein